MRMPPMIRTGLNQRGRTTTGSLGPVRNFVPDAEPMRFRITSVLRRVRAWHRTIGRSAEESSLVGTWARSAGEPDLDFLCRGGGI
jgi:hypothetical protein